MENTNKISVIVPVYNVEKYLDKCIYSLVTQTYSDLEIILIDDGSLDKSPQICDEWANCDSRIKVIHKDNGGLSDARNIGLDESSGDYIAFVDSDDWIDSDMMEGMLRVLKETEADIVNCQYIHYTDKDQKARPYQHKPFCISGKEALLLLLKDRQVTSHQVRNLSRREIWEGLRFPIGKVFEDMQVAPELFGRAKRITFVSNAYYHYRVNEQGIVKTINLKRTQDFVAALFSRKEFVEKNLPEYALEYDKRVFRSIYYEWLSLRRMLRSSGSIEIRKAIDYITPILVGMPFSMAPKRKYLQLMLVKLWYRISRK